MGTRVSISNVGDLGIVKDTKPYELPPEAWTAGTNVIFRDSKVERRDGHSAVFGTPNIPPEFAIAVPDAAGQVYWTYYGLAKASVYQGGVHTDITRASGDYTTTSGYDWNGGVFQGVLVTNNGTNNPQYWADISPAQRLQDLPNWPANTTAKVIRPFRSFLVALNVTTGGSQFPHRVRWSDRADPGTIPGSWDIADPTTLAGERDLTDTESGNILDGRVLRGRLFVYKESSTWETSFIGGQDTLKIESKLETSGLLTARCLSTLRKGQIHFLHNGDDVILFDGTEAKSVLDRRYRRYLNNDIDSENFANCFTFENSALNEGWFVYPAAGSTRPNKAVIWNSEENTIYERDFIGNSAAVGTIEELSEGDWDSDQQAWDDDPDPWARALRRQTLIQDATNTAFYQLDESQTFASTPYDAFVERTGLAVVGKDRQDRPKVDIGSRKFISRVWPKIEGGPVQVRVGGQETLDGSIAWQTTQTFDPSVDLYVDTEVNARLLAIRVEDAPGASVPWSMDGYDIEVEVVSEI